MTDLAALKPIFSRYSKILKSYTACNTISYKSALPFLIPRVLNQKDLRIHDHVDYVVVQSGSNAPLMIPCTLKSPQDYYRALIEVISDYGGVYDIPKPFADAIERTTGWTAMKRPWGDMDFVYETNTVESLPGRRLKRLRSDMALYRLKNFSVSPLNRHDVSALLSLEKRWAEPKREAGMRVGNIGYASQTLNHINDYPPELRYRALGIWDLDHLVGCTIACRITTNFWVLCYGFGDLSYRGIMTYGAKLASAFFEDCKYVLDGPGGAPESNLYHFKQKFLSEPVLHKQVYSRLVKRS